MNDDLFVAVFYYHNYSVIKDFCERVLGIYGNEFNDLWLQYLRIIDVVISDNDYEK